MTASTPGTVSRDTHLRFVNLLENWGRRARRAQIGHFEAASRLERMKYWLGMPVVVMTTVVGSSVFATLQKEIDTRIKIAVAVASVVSAILASIQTFLRHAERAEQHRITASKYGRLKKEIEQWLTFPPLPGDEKAISDSLLDRIDKLSQESPTIPRSVWRSTERFLEREQRRTKTPTAA